MCRIARPLAAVITSVLALAPVVAGPVNPPAGPVAPTHKTLTEVEPRIAVNAANTPGASGAMYVISQPGSYYLTGNITSTGSGSAIRIDASDVTLDLCGFRIHGAGAGQIGVSVSPSQSRCRIVNGTITGFQAWAVSGSNDTALEDLRIADCPEGVVCGPRSVARRVTIRNSTAGYAISMSAHGLVESCVVMESPKGILVNANSVVRGCSVSDATDTALNLAGGLCLVTGNRLRGSGTGISAGKGIISTSFGSRIEDNHLTFFDMGVELSGSQNLVVRNSFSRVNTAINAPTSIVGPMVTNTTIATNSNPHANYEQ